MLFARDAEKTLLTHKVDYEGCLALQMFAAP
jgi:hypothetical protein